MVKKYSGYFLLFVFLISLLPLINLLTPGLPITHDSVDHIARIANFYQSLSEGNLVPRWAANLNWGYGHPILMFLYPLPSYFASFFHFLGISLVDSFKLVAALSFILSGLFMFAWLREFLDKRAALLGAVLYLFVPYRFVEIYVRGDIGENLAFAFMPLVLFALSKLGKQFNLRGIYFTFLLSAFSFAGLILSHNAMSLLFFPFIVFYLICLYINERSWKKSLVRALSLILGFLISFFFWFPAFFEGKYTLRDIVTQGQYVFHFVNPKNLIYSAWSFGGSGSFTVQLGVTTIVLCALSLFLIKQLFKEKDDLRYLYSGTLLFIAVSIFLMLRQSSFLYHTFSILEKLQFPWRFLGLLAFYTSSLSAMFIGRIKTNNKNLLVVFLILLTIIPTVSYWHAKSYKKIPDNFFNNTYKGATDTGESAPIWSVRFMEKAPIAPIQILSGSATIVPLPRKTVEHEYVLKATTPVRLRENTLYFPGWKVYVDYKPLSNIEFQDPANRGVITFKVDAGLHDVLLKFEDTKLRRTANLISAISLLVIFICSLIILIIPKKNLHKIKW